MMFLGALLTPLARMANAQGARPRLLADDMSLITQGEQHENYMHTAGDTAHHYLTRAGAKLSKGKCAIFSTEKAPSAGSANTFGNGSDTR